MITLFMYIINEIFTPSVLKCAFKVWNVFNDNYRYMKTLIDTSCILNLIIDENLIIDVIVVNKKTVLAILPSHTIRESYLCHVIIFLGTKPGKIIELS